MKLNMQGSITSLTKILTLVRYRFLLVAGLFPYFLGAAIARRTFGHIDITLFLTGLAALFFVLVGVETFNEYFDWQLGTDRVFAIDPKPVTTKTFYIGLSSFFVAFLFALYLTSKVGWGIFIFSLIGFTAAAGYLGPPLRFTYRGLGELVIALSYGPFMVLGSYYLQTGNVSINPLLISIVPAILLFEIAITNEVPDFLQDRLVGKRNLCVRLGRQRAVTLYGFVALVFFVLCITGLVAGIFPKTAWLVLFLVPVIYYNYRKARSHCEVPALFLPVIRGTIISYIIAITILTLGFLI